MPDVLLQEPVSAIEQARLPARPRRWGPGPRRRHAAWVLACAFPFALACTTPKSAADRRDTDGAVEETDRDPDGGVPIEAGTSGAGTSGEGTSGAGTSGEDGFACNGDETDLQRPRR